MLNSINIKRKQILRNMICRDIKRMSPAYVLDNGSGEEGSWDYSQTPNVTVQSIDKLFGQDSHSLNFRRSVFDCVVFAGVFQYLNDPLKAIDECHRVLKNKGYLIFATINANSLLNGLTSFKAEKIVLTPSGLREIIEPRGFELVGMDILDFGLVPFNRKMILYAIFKKIK